MGLYIRFEEHIGKLIYVAYNLLQSSKVNGVPYVAETFTLTVVSTNATGYIGHRFVPKLKQSG